MNPSSYHVYLHGKFYAEHQSLEEARLIGQALVSSDVNAYVAIYPSFASGQGEPLRELMRGQGVERSVLCPRVQ